MRIGFIIIHVQFDSRGEKYLNFPVMFNLKTILDTIGVTPLLKEPPIKSICETFKLGVNISIVDCDCWDEKCFIEKINADKDINRENVITTMNNDGSVCRQL
jgi:hypothetical protein